MRHLKWPLASGLVLACGEPTGGTDVGNPAALQPVHILVYTQGLIEEAAFPELTGATLSLREANLLAEERGVFDPHDLGAPRLLVLDGDEQETLELRVPRGDYDALTLHVAPVLAQDEAATQHPGHEGFSATLEGLGADGRFSVRSNLDDYATLTAVGPAVHIPEGGLRLALVVNVFAWSRALPTDFHAEATRETHPSVLSEFDQRVLTSFRVHLDSNDDGTFSAEELAAEEAAMR